MSAHDAAQGPRATSGGVSRQCHSLYRRVEPLARVFRRTSGQSTFCSGKKTIVFKPCSRVMSAFAFTLNFKDGFYGNK